MKTIDELERYLQEECYSFTSLTIGHHVAYEGYVIEKVNDKYNFSYSERGNKRIIESFDSEKELVDYSLTKLNSDKWSKAHLVAWLYTESEINEAMQVLKDKNITYTRNDIPNFIEGKTAFRIFVFGKDVMKLEEFKRIYFKR